MCLLISSLSFSLAGLIIETVALIISFADLFNLKWKYPTIPNDERRRFRLLILFTIGMVLQIVGMVLQIFAVVY